MRFGNFEQPNGRRAFIKNTILTTTGVVLGVSEFKNNSNLNIENKNIEQKEVLPIIKREVWDDKWDEIRRQYEKPLGGTYYIKEKNKTLEKQALVYSYLDPHNDNPCSLKEDLKRTVIHHSGVNAGMNPTDEVRGVRNFHINKRKWNDVGYHYLISSDGQIFEGRPIDRVGSHAGSTFESRADLKEKFGENYKSLNPNSPNYLEKFNQYKNAIKKDPDYGSIGIVLLGDFNSDKNVSEAQSTSLKNLLNHLKGEYEIPKDNIIYHSEVDDLVVKPSGFRLNSSETNCPGDKFLKKDNILEKLNIDSEEALCKSINMDK
ncbi:MAG: peptidoglycan recognition family protein [Candidatus Paceibacterota bacterium]